MAGKTGRVTWIEHKGKMILFENYSGLKGDELLDVLYESEAIFKELTAPVSVLLDYTGSTGDLNFTNELKRLAKKYRPMIQKSASVGVTGFKKALSISVEAFIGLGEVSKYFDSIEDAKDYLSK